MVGVTATGNLRMKSFYSSYGISSADVAAPGGDSVLQTTPAAPNGRVLSTYPASLIGTCARPVFDGAAAYCSLGRLDGLTARRRCRCAPRVGEHQDRVSAVVEAATGDEPARLPRATPRLTTSPRPRRRCPGRPAREARAGTARSAQVRWMPFRQSSNPALSSLTPTRGVVASPAPRGDATTLQRPRFSLVNRGSVLCAPVRGQGL